MPPFSGILQNSNQSDKLCQAPFRGITTVATGAFGVAMISPLVLAVSLSGFIGDMSLQSFAAGLILAIIIDYGLGRLTRDGSHWPKLPRWVNSEYGLILAFVSGMIAFIMSVIPAPSWAPAVAIGGMHAFATASVSTVIFGGTRSAVWTIRKMK